MLTNKRLIFFKTKEFVGKFDTLDTEIPLTKIKQCTLDKRYTENSSVYLEMKNGKKHKLGFSGDTTLALEFSKYEYFNEQAIACEKWFNAIDSLLNATN